MTSRADTRPSPANRPPAAGGRLPRGRRGSLAVVLAAVLAVVAAGHIGVAPAAAQSSSQPGPELDLDLGLDSGAACAPVPDTASAQRDVLAQIRRVATELEARRLTNQLWEIWATAPDARAQRLLDQGMERRAVSDLDAAASAFDALVAYCPDYAEGYNQRAFVAFIRGDYAASLVDLERAVDRAPLHVAARAGMALSLMGLGRMLAARGVMREALDLHPWLPERHMLPTEGQATPKLDL